MISKRYVVIAAGMVLSTLASCTPSDEAQSATVDTTISTSNGDLAPLPITGTRYVVAPPGTRFAIACASSSRDSIFPTMR